MRGKIFEIKRFAVHDGDGIRTTAFLGGCPLRCIWCHNPEGLDSASRLAYYSHKCIVCGECVEACPVGAHTIDGRGHVFVREKCIACGKCAERCPGDALTLYGKEIDTAELVEKLLEDREFYENSGGGVTLSGGECLVQYEFCAEVLKKLRSEGIHTAVDTCGDVPQKAFDAVVPYTDIFLYDLKAIDEEVHVRCTGRTNKRILENLRYLDSHNKKIEIRIPFVPNHNDTQIAKMAELIGSLKSVTKVRVLPYHNYAASKYAALGMKNVLPDILPTNDEIENAKQIIRRFTDVTVTT